MIIFFLPILAAITDSDVATPTRPPIIKATKIIVPVNNIGAATDPDFLILDEPTRGIDIGTKTEIQKLIVQLAAEGKSVMFISSEIEEMLRTCNRMVVLRDGAKVGELDGELTQERVMAAIAGGSDTSAATAQAGGVTHG